MQHHSLFQEETLWRKLASGPPAGSAPSEFKPSESGAKRKRVQQHEEYVQKHRVQRASIPQGIKQQLGPRASDALQIACGAKGVKMGEDFIADVSQSVHRVRVMKDDASPTLTPAGKFVYRRQGHFGVLTPKQHLHLHSFPLTSLTFPESISEHLIQDLSGNSMHVKAVTVATLLAISSVNLQKGAPKADDLPATPASTYLTMLKWDGSTWKPQKPGGKVSSKKRQTKSSSSKLQKKPAMRMPSKKAAIKMPTKKPAMHEPKVVPKHAIRKLDGVYM